MPRSRTFGLDKDTIAFANRVKTGSGKVLLPDSLKQINKFVVGVKRLGLWNSMVCWPMRNMHNAGTGSTLYSLGGRGIYNATLTNNTNWSSDGLDMLFSTADTVSIAGFPISNLNNGLDFLAYLTPRGSSPAPSNSSNHLILQYPAGTIFYQFGTSQTGGTTNGLFNFYSNDGNRYFSSPSTSLGNIMGKSVVLATSNKLLNFFSPDVSIFNSGSTTSATTRTSPNTLVLRPNAGSGEVGCTMEFFITFDNFNTITNRDLVQKLYTRSFKTSKTYY